jgi:5'/3'-nucleotidase SurE
MIRPPINLRGARILVTNDDGIDAPGLKVAEDIARTFSEDVWVVAPETEQSGTGHSLTLTQPLRLREISEKRFSLGGSPTDCVLFAVSRIMEGFRPDIVLSGVNRGANVGDNVTYSGTVAAAMEGAILGLPSIALSQEREYDQPICWDATAHHGARIVEQLTALPWPNDVFMNVNFPNRNPKEVSGVNVVAQGRQDAGYDIQERIDPRSNSYFWIGPAVRNGIRVGDTDYQALERGEISVTPLHMDLTHHEALEQMKGAFS